MKLFAGIDGGQSSSVATLGAENGTILAQVTGAPADLVGRARASKRQAELLDALLAELLARAGMPGDARFAAIVAGLSGYDEGHSPVPHLQTASDASRFVHDTEIAHAGAFDGAPGIVVIAGTGSVAYGVSSSGARVRVGGWGYLFGDEGSAFWLGVRAIRKAMRAEDKAARSGSSTRILSALGLSSLRDVQHAFAHGELSRAQVAALAPLALEDEGLCDAAAARLAKLVSVAHRRLGAERAPAIATSGGVFEHAALRRAFGEHVRERLGKTAIAQPRYAPALGALRMAYALAGLAPELRGEVRASGAVETSGAAPALGAAPAGDPASASDARPAGVAATP